MFKPVNQRVVRDDRPVKLEGKLPNIKLPESCREASDGKPYTVSGTDPVT
jgi:hypothetical protein